MRFYTYFQNDNKGHFDIDNYVSHYVIIEASDKNEADHISSQFLYFDGVKKGFDCPCKRCGDRWTPQSKHTQGYNEPRIFGIPVREVYATEERKSAIIHYHNGLREEVRFLSRETKNAFHLSQELDRKKLEMKAIANSIRYYASEEDKIVFRLRHEELRKDVREITQTLERFRV